MCRYSDQNGHELRNKEIDDRLRGILVDSLDRAFEFAVQSRDVEKLGAVATLAAKCIDWDERPGRDFDTGFQPNRKEHDERIED